MSRKNRAKPCKLFVSCKKSCSCHAKNVQAVPHVMQDVPRVKKNKLFHMQKPCKTVQKPTCQNDMSLCSCKNHAKTMQNAARTERQPTEHPLSPGSLLYVLYVLYLTRQATEHPLSPGSLLYVLYVLYLARQATEHPLSPGSLLYVLHVLYVPI